MLFKNSHLLTTILTPALQRWLSSQLETVQGLHFQITSRDQQLLRGIIPKVFLTSEFAIYQGLQFDRISLTAENIHLDFTQLLKGQPLQLLNPIPLFANLRMTETHLNASLNSSLLQSGLQDFLSLLLKRESLPSFHWQKITLENRQFTLQGNALSSPQVPILIQAEASLSTPQHLLISPVRVEGINLYQDLSPIEFDLGSQVHLENLTLTEEAIFLQGKITINN